MAQQIATALDHERRVCWINAGTDWYCFDTLTFAPSGEKVIGDS